MILAASHLLALGIGWFVMGHHGEAGVPQLEKENPRVRRFHPSRIHERVDRSNPGGAMVWSLLEELDAKDELPETAPAADRAAAARKAIDAWVAASEREDLLLEAKLRFSHWLAENPREALTYWNGSGIGTSRAVSLFSDLVTPELERLDRETLASWLKSPKEFGGGPARDLILSALGKDLAKSGNPQLLIDLAADLDSSSRTSLYLSTCRAWPSAAIAKFEPVLRENPDPPLARAYLDHIDPAKRAAWVRGIAEGDGKLADLIRSEGFSRVIAAYARGGSLDERMDLMTRFSGGKPVDNGTRMNLVGSDVRDCLRFADEAADGATADWKHRLNQGEISVRQVMDAAKISLSEVAKAEPEEFRRVVFEQVAGVNPAMAMDLISDLPLQRREEAMLKAASSLGSAADPQRLFELMSQIPPGATSKANDRFQVWVAAAEPSYEKLGDSYVNWMMSLPHGVEQDMALSALAGRIEAKDPQLAATLRAAKTLPAGWRPGQEQ